MNAPSSTPSSADTLSLLHEMGMRARRAAQAMARASTAQKNAVLTRLAETVASQSPAIALENKKDLEAAEKAGHDAAFVDRLRLTDKVMAGMADGLRQVAQLNDPVGEISMLRRQPSGIQVGHMRVPLGVIGIIYESRPNVTIDAAALCLKSGNACLLRGGSEAIYSNQFLALLIGDALEDCGLSRDAVQVVPTTDRAAVGAMIQMPQYIDVIIPRGGKSLTSRIANEATVPVIKHLDGICHSYVMTRPTLRWPFVSVITPRPSAIPPATPWRRCSCIRPLHPPFCRASAASMPKRVSSFASAPRHASCLKAADFKRQATSPWWMQPTKTGPPNTLHPF